MHVCLLWPVMDLSTCCMSVVHPGIVILSVCLSVCASEWWGAGMVICLERSADLHMAQLMPLPLTVSCFNKIKIGVTFLVPADLGRPGQRAIKRVCVSVHHCICLRVSPLVSAICFVHWVS